MVWCFSLHCVFITATGLKTSGYIIPLALTAIISLPVLIWNIQYDFISFTYHGERVDMSGYTVNIDYFLMELLGEFLYNNPVNFILIILTLVVIARKKLQLTKAYTRNILLVTLPLIITFLVFSLFRKTLPHWSAPAYTTLLVLVAAWIDQLKNKSHFAYTRCDIVASLIGALSDYWPGVFPDQIWHY